MVKSFRYLLAFLLLPAFEGLTAGTIGISIHDSTVVQGNTVTFPVYVDSSLTGQNVTAFQFQFSYSTYVFAPDSVISAGTMSQSLGTLSFNLATEGKIEVAAAGSTPLTGSGILLYIRMRVIGTGGSYLSFTDAVHNFLNEGTPALSFHNGYIYAQTAPTIGVYPSSGSMTVGDSLQFYGSGGYAPYHWSITNGAVATIDSNGLLRATLAGTTRVVASDSHGTVDTTSGDVAIRAFRIGINDTSIIQGATFSLPVYVTSLAGLNVTSGSFDLTFNQNILSVEGVIQAGTLLSAYSAPAVNSNVSGKVSIAFAGTSPLAGAGVLIYVQFKVSTSNTGSTSVTPVNPLFNESIHGNSKYGNFNTINLANLNISPYTSSAVSGETVQFTASGGTPPYSWSTTDSTVATISNVGVLAPAKGGTVNVRAYDAYGGSGTSGAIQIYDTRVTVPDSVGVIGDTLTLPVYIAPLNSGNPVSSFQAQISYDSSIVHPLAVSGAGTLTEGWTYVPNFSGSVINFAAAGSTHFTSPGILCNIRLWVPPWVASGRRSALTFQQLLLNEGSPRPLMVNGGVTSSLVGLPSVPTLSSPANFSTGVGTNPTLSWNSSSGAITYRLQVSTDSTFATSYYNSSGIGSTSASISGLANLTRYFWRVSATNSGGNSSWSGAWSFTTIIAAPSAPTLSTPVSGATDVPVNPTVAWNSTTGAASYRLQVSTDPSFSTVNRDSAGITASSVGLSGLSNATTYYWRVSATNAGGTSSWAAPWHFTTIAAPPLAPTLSSPASGATGLLVPASLSWNSSAGATSYRIQISTDSNFVTTTYDSTDVAVTSVEVSALSHLTKYFWRISASNSGGTSAWSAVWNFTTTISPPAAPVLTGPASGSSGITLPPTLTWNSISSADSYRLQLSADSTFTVTTFDTSGVIATSISVAGLSHGMKYFWRVSAQNAGGSSAWSPVWSFTSMYLPPAPPSGLTATVSGFFGLTLNWTDNSSNETGFKLERTLDTSSSWILVSTLVPNSTTYLDSDLVDGTQYFYRLYSFNSGGNSAYTNVANAATIMRPPSSLSAAQIPGTKVELSWHDSSASETGFRIERKTGAGGTYAQIDSVGSDVVSYVDSSVTGGESFFYRVVGYNSWVVSSYSNEVNLTVTAIARNRNGIPDRFAISQNYPNPFNPSTQVEYALPSSSFVNLEVFDVMGRHVRTLVSRLQNAGYYAVTIDGTSLTSGVYFLRISAGKFVDVRKMVLMK